MRGRESKRVGRGYAGEPGATGCGFVVTLIGVADDQGTDVLAVEEVADADELAEPPAAAALFEADTQIREEGFRRSGLIVRVPDVDAAAMDAFARRVFSGQIGKDGGGGYPGQPVSGVDSGRAGRDVCGLPTSRARDSPQTGCRRHLRLVFDRPDHQETPCID